MGWGGWQGDPGRADNLYAEFEAKRLAAIAAGQDPHPSDPVETRTGRFTSAVWMVVGLVLAVGLAWLVAGTTAALIAAGVAVVAVIIAVLARSRRSHEEQDRP